jgi:enoyl-[acyl-carrier protein] reductase I
MAENLLKGKLGIITGALDENSIAWKAALKAHEQGAKFVLTNAPIAMRMGAIKELADHCKTIVIPADATSLEDIEKLYAESKEYLGGNFDFLLHSIGMSPNIRKGRSYGDLNYDWMNKSYDVSAISFHKMMHVAEKMDVLNEWGSIVGLVLHRCAKGLSILYGHGGCQGPVGKHRAWLRLPTWKDEKGPCQYHFPISDQNNGGNRDRWI